MPTLDAVKEFRQRMFDDSMALIDKKGADYNRAQQLAGDTLFNLKVAELLGIVPTAERGILVRLSDKFMRLISLMQVGEEAAVKDESIRDTVRDIHNYVDYALMLWEERREVATATVTPVEETPEQILRLEYPLYSAGSGRRHCGVIIPGGFYICTRASGHDGSHIAGGGRRDNGSIDVYEIWDTEETPEAICAREGDPGSRPTCGKCDLDNYICTRPLGHSGVHIADGSYPLRSWR